MTGTNLPDLRINHPDQDITVLSIAEDSPCVGRTLSQLNIRRHKEIFANSSADTDIWPEDEIVVMGAPADIIRLSLLFQP